MMGFLKGQGGVDSSTSWTGETTNLLPHEKVSYIPMNMWSMRT